MSASNADMVICCDPSLRRRVADAVENGRHAVRKGSLVSGGDGSTWHLSSGTGCDTSVNTVDGGMSIQVVGSGRDDAFHDVTLSVPMSESTRHDDRRAILGVMTEIGRMMSACMSPDDPRIVARTRGLTEFALDMSAVLTSEGIEHAGVRLRCDMQRPAAAFVSCAPPPLLRLKSPYGNWNKALAESPHAFASVQTIGAKGTHLAIGGAIVEIDATKTSTMEVLRRLPGIPVHLRKLL